MAIEPEPGSSYLDAEHVVILMQENRSFDHAFGTLKGVRGYNDPRAITLANNNPVWAQTNAAGETYAPFRLNLKDTKATWMGYLPHNWHSQVDARNHGKYDNWIEAKQSTRKEYAHMPLTMGHYSREDIPFYYSLADAFTICDQHFCSSITPTLPNRLYFMTGTVRNHQTPASPPNLDNQEIMHNHWSSDWTTFPERLEDNGVSWKIYQNEVGLETGLAKEEEAWLSNFGCNVMEYFPQYNIQCAAGRGQYLDKQIATFSAQIKEMSRGDEMALSDEDRMKLGEMKTSLDFYTKERARWSEENYQKLSDREKSLHDKAFCTNTGDPSYRELAELKYADASAERTVQVPKGDVFHQFRGRCEKRKAADRELAFGRSRAAFGPSGISVVWRVVYLRGAAHSYRKSGGLEEDHFHSDLRRKRRLFRSRSPLCSARSQAAGDRLQLQGNRFSSGVRLSGRE